MGRICGGRTIKNKIRRRDLVKGAIISGSFLLGTSIFGCAEKKSTPAPTKPAETPKSSPKEPIKIGFLGPLSGPFTPWGESHLNGAQMAVDEINASGGVLERPVELVIRDTKGKPNEATILFEELVYQEKVSAIVGPVPSDVGLAVAKKADELKVPVLLHKAASDKILTKNSRYTFRTAELPASTLLQGFAEYVKSMGFSKIGAIVADYAWGHAIKEGIEKYIATIPGIQVRIEVAPVRESDFSSYLRKLGEIDPELIIATGHPPGTSKITKQGIELGLKARYLGIALPKKALESALGDKVTEGFLTHATVNFEAQEFTKLAEKFASKYGGELDFESTTGYVNVNHVAWAINQAGSGNPDDVANAIRNGSYETPLFVYPFAYTDWGDLKEMKVVIISFKPGAPQYYPEALSHVEIEFISPPLYPQEPQA